MSEIDNGGPAFPNGEDVTLGRYAPHTGMSLRDYFAAKAMLHMLTLDNLERRDEVAEASYLMADAMIAERKKQKLHSATSCTKC